MSRRRPPRLSGSTRRLIEKLARDRELAGGIARQHFGFLRRDLNRRGVPHAQ
jgi:hypothetical protein